LYLGSVCSNIVVLGGVPESKEESLGTTRIHINAHQVTSQVARISAGEEVQVGLDIALADD
jgi:hypothetical protein